MPHPDISKPQVAKRAAIALANAIGPHCRIEQRADGSKRVYIGNRHTDHATWYSVYSQVYAIRLDSVLTERRNAANG